MANTDIIKSINQLLQYNFFIPAYQRGYRWTTHQVTDLLDDVWEFINKENKKDSEWYCLQPVVIIKCDEDTKTKNNLDGDWYEVIDGQQRLTTLFLILKHLERFVESDRKVFKIKYQTRKDSEIFLKEIELKNAEESNDNVDYYHMYDAYSKIKEWFKTKADEGYSSISSKFITPFLEKTMLIWYEPIPYIASNDSKYSIDIFTRINSGKIPLTNAELIKALFLNSSNFSKDDKDNEKLRLKQLEIASEWDRIEYALQNDSFWCFINKEKNEMPTRIDFIFNLMYEVAQSQDDEIGKRFGNDAYSTFRFFSDKFKTKSDEVINNNWQEIKKYFQTLEEWYTDRELYHKIGYLIAIGIDIKKILTEKKEKSKTEFICWLDVQIKKVVTAYSKQAIDELEYGEDNGQLIKTLLLHNIITTLKSDDISLKFPFDKYKDKKNGGWSLEHIHAQNSDDITEIDDFEEWVKVIDEDTFTDDIKKKFEDFKKDKQKEDIPTLVRVISELFGEIEIHSIENMALLSKNDNSKLNNGLFPVKRKRIIELEKNGAFIPIATKKIFQKYFDGSTKQLSKWEEGDRTAYLNDIKETLKQYLPQATPINNEQ